MFSYLSPVPQVMFVCLLASCSITLLSPPAPFCYQEALVKAYASLGAPEMELFYRGEGCATMKADERFHGCSFISFFLSSQHWPGPSVLCLISSGTSLTSSIHGPDKPFL